MRITMTLVILFLTTIAAKAQCRYCSSYENFVNNQWEELDTIYCDSHSKQRQIWWGGNDYAMKTNNKDINKMLKKNAFAVMLGDTLYINCRNLCYEKMYFGSGYARARRIGDHSLFLVNKIIGIQAQRSLFNASFAFGLAGSYIAAKKQMDQQVCYVISNGADSKGIINIRLVDDQMIKQMVSDKALRKEYFSEKEKKKRLLAKHIVPILDKAGLFRQQPESAL